MKIVVIGGAGRVGAGVVALLAGQGHEVTAASRRTGVDVITGAGLREALAGAEVVVDVVNSPSFEDEVALRFFETSTRNLLAVEAETGVSRHVAISIVGAERLSANGYFRAKHLQERMVQAAGFPHTILRSTQFFEFIEAIVRASTVGGQVWLAPARIQPIAAADAAQALAQLAVAPASDAVVEIAGPDSFRLDELVGAFMAATGDTRPVVADPAALYFGTALNDETLMAGENLRFGRTDFDAWLARWVRAHAREPAH
jgi:uncharacterized protein YbjT (DUF2867 family)